MIDTIVRQSAVLFLGAGASFGALHPRGQQIPDSEALRNLLSERFLGGKLKNRSLSHVSEMCISESDLISVQSYIREELSQFTPAPHHLIIPRFSWHAIVTTNYDLIVEKAYADEPLAKQELAVFTRDTERIDTIMKRITNGVRYIKLHGCIKSSDEQVPLILSKEQQGSCSRGSLMLRYPLTFGSGSGVRFKTNTELSDDSRLSLQRRKRHTSLHGRQVFRRTYFVTFPKSRSRPGRSYISGNLST